MSSSRSSETDKQVVSCTNDPGWWDCNNCSRKFSCLLLKEARQISDFAPLGWEASPLDGFEGLLSTQQLCTVEQQWNVEEFEGSYDRERSGVFLMRMLRITVKVQTQCNS